MARLTARRTAKLLDLLVPEVEEIATQQVGADTCVLQSNVLSQTLRAAGAVARPFPVRLRALSPEYARRMKEGRAPDGEGEDREEWAAAGAKGLLLGFSENVSPDRYNGHLVVIAANRYLADPSIVQVNRPEVGLVAEPFYTFVGPTFLRDGEPVAVEMANGTLIIYEPNAPDKDWLNGQEPGVWRSEPVLAQALLRRVGWDG